VPDDIAEVYRNTYPALVRFLYRKVWDAERAEDLAQEAFARALVHRPEKTRGWLFVVAANMARDEARRAAREKRHLTLLKSEPDAVHTSPEEEIDAATDAVRVRTALDQLTPRDRGALLERASALLGAARPVERPAPAFEQLRRALQRSPWHVRRSFAWAASVVLALGLGYYIRNPRLAPGRAATPATVDQRVVIAAD